MSSRGSISRVFPGRLWSSPRLFPDGSRRTTAGPKSSPHSLVWWYPPCCRCSAWWSSYELVSNVIAYCYLLSQLLPGNPTLNYIEFYIGQKLALESGKLLVTLTTPTSQNVKYNYVFTLKYNFIQHSWMNNVMTGLVETRFGKLCKRLTYFVLSTRWDIFVSVKWIVQDLGGNDFIRKYCDNKHQIEVNLSHAMTS